MTWRSRPLLLLPIGFLLFLPPNGGWAHSRATSTVTATISPLIITCSASAILKGRPRADVARQRGRGTRSSPARRPPPRRHRPRGPPAEMAPQVESSCCFVWRGPSRELR